MSRTDWSLVLNISCKVHTCSEPHLFELKFDERASAYARGRHAQLHNCAIAHCRKMQYSDDCVIGKNAGPFEMAQWVKEFDFIVHELIQMDRTNE